MRRSLTCLTVLALVALSACSDDSPTPAAPTSSTTSSTSAPAPSDPPAGPFPPAVKLTPVATVEEPVAFAIRADDAAVYVAEKTGRVRAIRDGRVDRDPVLDIRDQVSTGSEQGLLGIAFAPDGAHLYVNFTNREGHTRVVEYAMGGARADADSRRELLRVEQPYPNHNGGHVLFGPDGLLYIGLGDGGSRGDPHGNGQNRNTLLGKILRIDPRSGGDDPYRIPEGNPFVGVDGARPEVWAYGLRNPWRFSFDRATGELWVADVGQNEVEEINRVPGDEGGLNYGWDRREGTRRFEGERPPDAIEPVHEYPHPGGCSVTGGFVYRGEAIPALRGSYVFADYCAGQISALRPGGSGFTATPLGVQTQQVSSFGEDATGELYVLSQDGAVLRLDASG